MQNACEIISLLPYDSTQSTATRVLRRLKLTYDLRSVPHLMDKNTAD